MFTHSSGESCGFVHLVYGKRIQESFPNFMFFNLYTYFVCSDSPLYITRIHFFFRLNEFYKRVHTAAKNLSSYQQIHVRYHNHNVKNLMNKLSSRDKILFDFDMSTLSWDDYFDKYLKGLRVYLMGNPLHMPETNSNTLNRYLNSFFHNDK